MLRSRTRFDLECLRKIWLRAVTHVEHRDRQQVKDFAHLANEARS